MNKIKAKPETSCSRCLTVNELLINVRSKLAAISDTPMLDAQLLLALALEKDRAWVIAHNDHELDSEIINSFWQSLSRRLTGEPLAYIIGTRDFWRREFLVSPAVLVPRPETELLVETLLSRLSPNEQHVVDLGTGSGAIAISIAAERPAWVVTGVDCSPDAIAMATKNATDLSNISMLVGNWCDDIPSRSVDAIVSNPPYVRENDTHLAKLTSEPMIALTAGPDGLDAIRAIIPSAFDCLKPGGLLLIEHGYDQQGSVLDIYRQAGFQQLTELKDSNNIRRAVLGYRE